MSAVQRNISTKKKLISQESINSRTDNWMEKPEVSDYETTLPLYKHPNSAVEVFTYIISFLITSLFIVFLPRCFIDKVNYKERAIFLRFGRIRRCGHSNSLLTMPGIYLTMPFIDYIQKVPLMDTVGTTSLEVLTHDGAMVDAHAEVTVTVEDAVKILQDPWAYNEVIRKLTRAHLQTLIGSYKIEELLKSEQEVEKKLLDYMKNAALDTGMKVQDVYIKYIKPDISVAELLEKVVVAEKEAEISLIKTKAENESIELLAQHEDKLNQSEKALQLRYLVAFNKLAAKTPTTIYMPLPMDM